MAGARRGEELGQVPVRSDPADPAAGVVVEPDVPVRAVLRRKGPSGTPPGWPPLRSCSRRRPGRGAGTVYLAWQDGQVTRSVRAPLWWDSTRETPQPLPRS